MFVRRPRSTPSADEGRGHLVVTLVLLAICCGILTGFGEFVILWFRHLAFGRMMFGSRHALWMAPLAYAILFGIMSVALVPAALLAPRRATLRVGLFSCVTFSVFLLFLPFPQVHHLAALLLAMGVAVQTTRAVTAPGRQPAMVARRAASWLVGAVLLATVGAVGWEMVRERRAFAALPAADPAAPNVLLIILDTVRAASLSLYGHEHATTPTLERLAQQGIVFDLAIATSPWTLPSHGTVFTGRYPHELSTDWFTPLDDTFPTVAEVFRDRGYATGGFSANGFYASHHTGLDRGFRTYQTYRLSLAQVYWSAQLMSSYLVRHLAGSDSVHKTVEVLRKFEWSAYPLTFYDQKNAAAVNAEFLRWQSTMEGRPFFAFLNYMDAHKPYRSPSSYQDRFTAGSATENRYDAAIAYLDDQVADLLGKLQQRGELDKTVVVIASDHGELLGERGLYGHAQSLYFRSLHVPLLILAPGKIGSAVRVPQPVSLRDLSATLLDLAGLDGVRRFPGWSLSRYWTGAGGESSPLLSEVSKGYNTPPAVPVSRGPMRSLVGRGMHYILNGDGEEELYDYQTDDAETTNLLHSEDSLRVGPMLLEFRKDLRNMLRGKVQ